MDRHPSQPQTGYCNMLHVIKSWTEVCDSFGVITCSLGKPIPLVVVSLRSRNMEYSPTDKHQNNVFALCCTNQYSLICAQHHLKREIQQHMILPSLSGLLALQILYRGFRPANTKTVIPYGMCMHRFQQTRECSHCSSGQVPQRQQGRGTSPTF